MLFTNQRWRRRRQFLHEYAWRFPNYWIEHFRSGDRRVLFNFNFFVSTLRVFRSLLFFSHFHFSLFSIFVSWCAGRAHDLTSAMSISVHFILYQTLTLAWPYNILYTFARICDIILCAWISLGVSNWLVHTWNRRERKKRIATHRKRKPSNSKSNDFIGNRIVFFFVCAWH